MKKTILSWLRIVLTFRSDTCKSLAKRHDSCPARGPAGRRIPRALCLAVALALLPPLLSKDIIFYDAFINNLDNWQWTAEKDAMPLIDPAMSHDGFASLLLPSKMTLRTKPISVEPHTRYELTLDSYSEVEGRFTVRIEEYDAEDKGLLVNRIPRLGPTGVNSTGDAILMAGKGGKRKFWYTMDIPFDTSAECRSVRIMVYKWSNDKVWLNNVIIRKLDKRELFVAEPLLPENAGAFDCRSLALPGPDGLLYPNWVWAGAHSDKTAALAVFKVEDQGAIPDDGKDDTAAIEASIALAAGNGGGVVQFGKGCYRLTRKIAIRDSRIVLRGLGQAETRLEFGLPDSGVIILPIGNTNIRSNTPIEIFFPAEQAQKISVALAGEVIQEFTKTSEFIALPDAPSHKKIRFPAKDIVAKAGKGLHLLEATVTYSNGETRSATASVNIAPDAFYNGPYAHSVISFVGKYYGPDTLITSSLRRGDRVLTVEDASHYQPGDYVSLWIAPEDAERWNRLVRNICTAWGIFREFVTVVEKVEGNQLTLLQPVRIDYPLEDKPRLRLFRPIEHCGIMDMSLAQLGEIQQELKMGTVIFSSAAQCRAENLLIHRPGTQGVLATTAKFCQVRNCTFDTPWRTKKGGLAYAGWERSWDCLTENLKTVKMRHAPILNWTCSGNVIRNSVFEESDAQWHSGWCRDNLFEQCSIVTTTQEFNSYGYAFYSTPNNDSQHGPNGPRNVIYNCQSDSLFPAFYLGGMNQQWMLMYNTATVQDGPAIVSRLGNRDNVIKGNVFRLKTDFPMIFYEFLDNVGDRVEDNLIIGGSGKLAAGAGTPGSDRNNTFLPATAATPKSRPPAPSIYLWQKERYPLPDCFD